MRVLGFAIVLVVFTFGLYQGWWSIAGTKAYAEARLAPGSVSGTVVSRFPSQGTLELQEPNGRDVLVDAKDAWRACVGDAIALDALGYVHPAPFHDGRLTSLNFVRVMIGSCGN